MSSEEEQHFLTNGDTIGDGWTPGCMQIAVFHEDGRSAAREQRVGWVRNSLGIWNYLIPLIGPNGEDVQFGISYLVHTATGFGLGAFVEPQEAAEAGEIAERMADWSKLDIANEAPLAQVVNSDEWKVIGRRLRAAWDAAGFMVFARHDHAVIRTKALQSQQFGAAVGRA